MELDSQVKLDNFLVDKNLGFFFSIQKNKTPIATNITIITTITIISINTLLCFILYIIDSPVELLYILSTPNIKYLSYVSNSIIKYIVYFEHLVE